MSLNKKLIFLSFFVVAFGASVEAAPDIFLSSVYDFLPSDQASYNKSISNNGDTTAFVTIAVKEVKFDKNGKVVEGELLSGDGMDDRLVVSPNRLIIPAKGSRSSRVMFTGSRDVERYFRVSFVPVLPTQENGFGTQAEIESQRTLSAGFNVLIGYGALVYIAPKNATYDTKFNNLSDRFEIVNNGTASVKFTFFVMCSTDKKCTEPSTAILRPGKAISYDKKSTSSVRFILVEGRKEKEHAFKF